MQMAMTRGFGEEKEEESLPVKIAILTTLLTIMTLTQP
jgi:hypothetical protein